MYKNIVENIMNYEFYPNESNKEVFDFIELTEPNIDFSYSIKLEELYQIVETGQLNTYFKNNNLGSVKINSINVALNHSYFDNKGKPMDEKLLKVYREDILEKRLDVFMDVYNLLKTISYYSNEKFSGDPKYKEKHNMAKELSIAIRGYDEEITKSVDKLIKQIF